MKIDKSNVDLISEDSDFVELVRCKNDFLTAAITKNNAKRLVHSKYDPVKEARNQVAAFVENVRTKGVFLVFGLGMGYHLFEFLKHLPIEGKAFILEPSANMLRLFFENGGKTYLEDNRLSFFYVNKSTVAKDIDAIVTMDNCEMMAFYCHPVYENMFKSEYEILVKALNNAITNCLVQKNSIRAFGKGWCLNFLLNYKHIKQSAAVKNLFGLFKDKTAIIVSAGPSLNKNVHLLKSAKNKAVIICTDTAYRVLKLCETEPDIIVSVSGSSHAPNKFRDIEYSAPLVFKDQTSNEIVSGHSGIKFYSNYINDFLADIFFELGIDSGRLESGGSVACTALDLAVKTGAKTVIFVGQDLAVTDDKSHADNVTVPISLENHKDYIIETTDIFGNNIKTLKNLNEYRLWIEAYIRGCDWVRFVDATEGGALIEGTKIMDLASAIEEIPDEALDAPGKIEKCFTPIITAQQNRIVINGYETAYNYYLSAIDIINDLISTYSKKRRVSQQQIVSVLKSINDYTYSIRYAVLPFLFNINDLRIKKMIEAEISAFEELLTMLYEFSEPFLSVLEE